MFRRLVDYLRNGRTLFDRDRPWDLTPEEFRQLKQLRADPGFDIYLKLLDSVVNLEAEKLLSVSSDRVENLRGFIAGLRAAPAAVDVALNQKENIDVRRDEREQRRASARDRRSAATFASPAWGRSTGS